MGILLDFAFDRTSSEPVDSSLVLSKAEMLAVNDNMMPDKYFAVCKDDGGFYIYDKSATPSAETGKFTELKGGGGEEGKTYTMDWDEDTHELTLTDGTTPQKLELVGLAGQVDTMPTAAAGDEGKIVQYIGATDANYTNGYFYQCVEVTPATDPKTYEWVQKNVQSGGGGSSVEFDALSSSATIYKVDGGVTERLSIDLEDNTKKIAVDIRNSGISSEKRWHAETEQSLRKDTLTGATPDLSLPNGATLVTTLDPNPLSLNYVVMDNNDAWTGVRATDTSPFIFNRKGTSTELCRLTVTESSPGEWEVNASDGTLDGKTWNFFIENPVVPRVQSWLDLSEIQTAQATDSTLGTIKLNPSESVGVNENGQLTVGGRLGQFPNGGLYYPTTADPVNVGNYTFLMSEAKGLSAAHRELIIAGGSTITLKTAAAAGATQYRISNTMTNRFLCSAWIGGRLAVDEASAKDKTVAITSVKFANGNNVTAYHGGTESNNDIIITVDETLNPSGTLSSVRGYGTWVNADTISAGQGNRTGGGKILQVGQGLTSDGNVNQVGMIGIRQYNTAGNSFMVGSDNINKKNYSAIFGQGIDNTNGVAGGAYFGTYPDVKSDTAFVVGNGTAYDAKSNLFEIKTNGDIYINGVKQ